MSLQKKITRHLDSFTVIETVFEILRGHIEALESRTAFAGLTAQQVQEKFNEQAKRLGKLWFFPSYLQRHTKTGDFFVEENGKYRLRDELVQGVSLAGLKALREQILNHWATAKSARERLLAEFQSAKSLARSEIEARREVILQSLVDADAQIFEILSFAILKSYFSALGFSLKRFSTTFANDGGMDFIGDDGIYQVTVGPTKTKIERDLGKLPGTKRVLVAPSFSDSLRAEAQRNDVVLEVIDSRDLSDHFLRWLCEKDQMRREAEHLQKVIETALVELNRD